MRAAIRAVVVREAEAADAALARPLLLLVLVIRLCAGGPDLKQKAFSLRTDAPTHTLIQGWKSHRLPAWRVFVFVCSTAASDDPKEPGPESDWTPGALRSALKVT